MLHWTSLVVLFGSRSEAFCPQGFGNDAFFPPEWKIPKWPTDMDLDTAARLRTVQLGGFTMESLNEEYLEGPGPEFVMQGRETFWQSSGKFFMYYCKRFDKWRIAEISAFGQNMEGSCFAFCSDAHPGRDILNETLLVGWIEVEKGKWEVREKAGVVKLATLGDQMGEEEVEEEVPGDPNCETASGESPFGEDKEKKSNCPVMPAVRKVKKKVVQAVGAVGKWAKRLFPKMLGAPDEEDAIPEDDSENPLFGTEEGEEPEGVCEPSTQNGCSFKEKFYIEKQLKITAEQRATELQRLRKMEGIVMKPEQTEWLLARISILKKMVKSDKEKEKKGEL